MKFKFYHSSINVYDLERSITFYEKALGLTVVRAIDGPKGEFKLRFLGNEPDDFLLELTWVKGRATPYNLGDKEFHFGFSIPKENYEEAFARHTQMGCVTFVNDALGIYFIEDPDGYWLEIVPERDSR